MCSRSLPLIFTLRWWPLPFLILSPLLQNFPVVLPTKKKSPLFLNSRSKSLSPFFSLSFAGLLPLSLSLFLCLSLALYSKFVDMTTPIQKQFPLSVFVFIDSFVLLYKTPLAMRFPAKITLSCIWVTIPVD